MILLLPSAGLISSKIIFVWPGVSYFLFFSIKMWYRLYDNCFLIVFIGDIFVRKVFSVVLWCIGIDCSVGHRR